MPRRASPRHAERTRQRRGAAYRTPALQRAFRAADKIAWERLGKRDRRGGGISLIAEHLGITLQAVSEWPEPPLEHVKAIERLTGVSRFKLRPDLKDFLS